MATLASALLAPALLAAAPLQAAPTLDAGAWTVETPKDAPSVLRFADPAPRLTLTCPKASGQIAVEVVARSGLADWPEGRNLMPVSVTLASGASAATLRGEATRDASGATTVRTELASRAPVIEAFKATGAIAVTARQTSLATPALANRTLVRKFLTPCR